MSLEVAGGQNITLSLPANGGSTPALAIEFEIKREYLASSQTATFRIYNLPESIRNLVWKDQYMWAQFRAIQFWAGYGTFAPLIFNGSILRAYTVRGSGELDNFTILECYDGGYQMTNGFTSTVITPGTPASRVIAQLAQTLPQVRGQPIVGSFPATNLRGEVLFGNTWDLIQRKSQGQAIIDNGQVKVLNMNETITGDIPLIDASTGLLGAPERTDALINFTTVFEPRVTVGQALQLKSTVNALFDGNYKVMGFTHSGRISEYGPAGEARTNISLWLGTQSLTPVAGTPIQ